MILQLAVLFCHALIVKVPFIGILKIAVPVITVLDDPDDDWTSTSPSREFGGVQFTSVWMYTCLFDAAVPLLAQRIV